MIDILIVEDSDPKIQRVKSLIGNYPEIKAESVEICKDIRSSKLALAKKQFDLVILDVQVPIREGEPAKMNGGIDLLQELHTRTIYKKPTCIVGLTEHKYIMTNLSNAFGDRLWSIIFYDASTTTWSERLAGKIEYLIESKKQEIQTGSYEFDLGIITALISPEFEYVLKLDDWVPLEKEGDSARYYKTIFASSTKSLSVVAVCAPQMGMPSAAVTASKMITHFHPKYLALVGITAGVPGRVNLGDVLVADPSWDWGSGKRRPKGRGYELEPDPLPERLSPFLRSLFHDVRLDNDLVTDVWSSWTGPKPANSPSIHSGPCASGACVVADGSTVEVIRQHNRKLIGLEMEAYGVMHAAVNSIAPQPMAFSIKAVCDFAGPDKSDDLQEFAAFESANLLKRIALRYF